MKKTIFVLEDRQSVIDALARQLSRFRKQGFHVFFVKNQLEARRFEKGLKNATVVLLDRDCPFDETDKRFDGGSFHREIPSDVWSRCIGISGEEKWNRLAAARGAVAAFEKVWTDLDGWAETVAAEVERVIKEGEQTRGVMATVGRDRFRPNGGTADAAASEAAG